MTVNVGSLDRVLRVVVGTLLLCVAWGVFPGYTTAWGWIGIIPLATGIVGTCPLYTMLGLNTNTS